MLSVTALALVSSVGLAGTASADIPCWKQLMNDWYAPPIKHMYPIHCYRDALNHLPTDVEEYSNAREDILRAMQEAITYDRKLEQRTHHTLTTIVPASLTTTATTTNKTAHRRRGAQATAPAPPAKKPSPLASAIREITPGGPEAFPLPLLILGALAILLILAGVAGMLWRRLHGRSGKT